MGASASILRSSVLCLVLRSTVLAFLRHHAPFQGLRGLHLEIKWGRGGLAFSQSQLGAVVAIFRDLANLSMCLEGRERTGAVPGDFAQGDSFGAVSNHGKMKNPH